MSCSLRLFLSDTQALFSTPGSWRGPPSPSGREAVSALGPWKETHQSSKGQPCIVPLAPCFCNFPNPWWGRAQGTEWESAGHYSLTDGISWKRDPNVLSCFPESLRLAMSAIFFFPKGCYTVTTAPWESKSFQFETRVNVFNMCEMLSNSISHL